MATPVEPIDNPFLKNAHNVYGDASHRSDDGKYWFEWTPFTPAVRAWESAQRYLSRARDQMVEAGKLSGFAIPGLQGDYENFKTVLQELTKEINERAAEAGRVVQALDVANRDYAKAHEASYEDYARLMGKLDGWLEDLGRRSPVRDAQGNPFPRDGDPGLPAG